MDKPRFGRLGKVNLQEVWNSNGEEFLRWLSQESNLSLLASQLGMDLEVVDRQENPVESAYLLCRERETGDWVLVVAPVSRPDPGHLGQLLAYASEYRPVCMVSMAGRITREYQRLLEWFNQVTDDSVAVYSVEIEFWRINDSPLAPRFLLAGKPGGGGADQRPPARSGPASSAATPPEPERRVDEPVRKRPPARAEPVSERPSQGDGARRRETPSGLLRRFQARESAVSPSGMLRKISLEDTPDARASRGGNDTGELTDQQKTYLEFWAKFWEDVIRWETDLPPKEPMLQGWVTFPIDLKNFYLIAFINIQHKIAGVGLVMDGPEAKDHFRMLYDQRDAIESEIGAALDWRELPGKDESHIYLHLRDVDPEDRRQWRTYQRWFAEALDAFSEVLGTRVEGMESTYQSRERPLP